MNLSFSSIIVFIFVLCTIIGTISSVLHKQHSSSKRAKDKLENTDNKPYTDIKGDQQQKTSDTGNGTIQSSARNGDVISSNAIGNGQAVDLKEILPCYMPHAEGDMFKPTGVLVDIEQSMGDKLRPSVQADFEKITVIENQEHKAVTPQSQRRPDPIYSK